MTLDELKVIRNALAFPSWEVRSHALAIIDREINLKTMDPRKSREDNECQNSK